MTSVHSAMHQQERKTLEISTQRQSSLLIQQNVIEHWQIWRKRKKLGKKQKSERRELCYSTSWLRLSVRRLSHSLKSKSNWFLVYREKGNQSIVIPVVMSDIVYKKEIEIGTITRSMYSKIHARLQNNILFLKLLG